MSERSETASESFKFGIFALQMSFITEIVRADISVLPVRY